MIGSRANRSYVLLEIGLLALCLGFAFTLEDSPGGRNEGDIPPVANRVMPTTSSQAEQRASLPNLDALRNYRERPPFSATRRPPPTVQAETAPVAATAPVQPLRAELVGIIGPSERRTALLRNQGAPDLLRVTVGDRVGGWQIMAVGADRITLEQGGQQQILGFPRLEDAPKH